MPQRLRHNIPASADTWRTKCSKSAPLTLQTLKPNPKATRNPDAQIKGESSRLLQALPQNSLVVLCDERGKRTSSEEFAKMMRDAGDGGWREVVFCIGGPYGVDESVRTRADKCVRLSDMVLNHEVSV